MESTASALSAMSIDNNNAYNNTNLKNSIDSNNNGNGGGGQNNGGANDIDIGSGGGGLTEQQLHQHNIAFSHHQSQSSQSQSQQQQQLVQNDNELQLPIITPDQLPPEMLEVFNTLDEHQQIQALEMLAQQQLLEVQQQQQQQSSLELEEAQGMAVMGGGDGEDGMAGGGGRPEEHFLTIALNGTILGATEMITGYNPSNLLMTSAFDAVHEDDLLGLHAIKTHFWERDQPDVEVYLRRRTIDNEWIWLMAKVVSYIDSPVPGIIVHEVICYNVNVAMLVSKVTRIASLLLQSVENCLYGDGGDGHSDSDENNSGSASNFSSLTSTVMGEDAAEIAKQAAAASSTTTTTTSINNFGGGTADLQVDETDTGGGGGGDEGIQGMISDVAKEMGIDLTDSENPLMELMNAAQQAAGNKANTNRGSSAMEDGGAKTSSSSSDLNQKSMNNKVNKDPLDYLKMGACLDLAKIILTEGEVKLVTLVLTGRLQIEDLGPLLYLALNSPEMNLVAATDEFYHLSEVQLANQRNTNATIGGDDIATSAVAGQLPPNQQVGAPPPLLLNPPPLSVINLSYTEIGDYGMEALSEFIYSDNIVLKTLDLSFCNISSQGLLALCHGLKTRSARGLPQLQALALCGNTIKLDAAKLLGKALSSPLSSENSVNNIKRKRGESSMKSGSLGSSNEGDEEDGLKLLHLGSTSISPRCLVELLSGLGPSCPIQELKLQSNGIGPEGAATLVTFLDAKHPDIRNTPVLPKLNRLDLSYNELGDNGTAKLTKAISKRAKSGTTQSGMAEVSLSGNDMGSKGIESIMNKLLQHKLVTLNLDNNSIGDQGCQLVAASLPTIPSLSRLNLAFNDIGCRGMATLMRSLVGCESITSLGLSGNVMRISGAIAMGFTLAQHPRLSILELDNCCLSQVAQCHIVAGIISNRWVPMKVMHGFRAGPPMVAIGALEIAAQHMTNEVCFRLRRDIQMKTLLQWMENNRNKRTGKLKSSADPLTSDILSEANEASGAPSQSAYLRMLDWLGRIPFDESELMDLRKYFYDISGGDGDQKSESNLKHRGDILAALASDVVEEILESDPIASYLDGDSSVGLDLSQLFYGGDGAPTASSSENPATPAEPNSSGAKQKRPLSADCVPQTPEEMGELYGASIEVHGKQSGFMSNGSLQRDLMSSRDSMSTISMSMAKSNLSCSHGSMASLSRSDSQQTKARITMFPQFAAKLDNLKAVAQEMMDSESDPVQQDVIAQQFAEASLTILRQLRYHCMESGLDGWRQGKLRRKVLIVDDSIVTRKMVARAFEKANFIVDTAEDGVKGVNKMKESIYDIAFMDIDMPVMNGFDATKAFRMWEDSVRPGARQPICALTAAHVDDFDRNELMKFKDAGLDVMESKPCNIPRLFKVVDDVSPMFSDLSINIEQFDGSVMS